MTDDVDAEKSRLRALAFGQGTQSDEERKDAASRLRQLEPASAAKTPERLEPSTPVETDPEPTADSARAIDAEHAADPGPNAEHFADRTPRRRAVLVVLAAIIVVAVLASLAIVRKHDDSLAVFKRPDASGVPMPDDIAPSREEPEGTVVRHLIEYEGYDVWAKWSPVPVLDAEGAWVPSRDVMICVLTLDGSDHVGGTCTDEATFRAEGIESTSFELSTEPDGTSHRVRFVWGPTGAVRTVLKTVPPKETFDEMVDRDPTERDLAGLPALVKADDRAADTMRWVADYHGYGIWLYPKGADVCMLVADPDDAVSAMASDCTPRESFVSEGIAVPWEPDDATIKLSPELGLRTVRG